MFGIELGILAQIQEEEVLGPGGSSVSLGLNRLESIYRISLPYPGPTPKPALNLNLELLMLCH